MFSATRASSKPLTSSSNLVPHGLGPWPAALTSKQPELKSAVITVAFLLKASIADHVSNVLAEAVASKAIDKIGGLVDRLGSTADFLVANDMKRAESTLELKATSAMLEGVYTSLDALASKLAKSPLAPPQKPTWALVTKAAPATLTTKAPTQHPPSDSLLSPMEMLSIQQCLK
ncbi:hypothetical protein E4T56_gene4498 [Termitomyces sp. T112]|nr:hypothetical protein E4T56_gene4498 [Termitomyces sp. T112]